MVEPLNLYGCFADVLDYPDHRLIDRIDVCLKALGEGHASSARLMEGFRRFVKETNPGRLEEIYTNTFDLQASCHPYVGPYLFGEDYGRRSYFMAGLNARYRRFRFYVEDELPDHLTVILRFVSLHGGQKGNHEVVGLCLIPAIEKMLQGFKSEGHPYRAVLQALLLLFQEEEEQT